MTYSATAPRLQSLSESVKVCPGWNIDEGCVNGGDEPDEGEEICFACVRAEDKHYRDLAMREDYEESLNVNDQYRYLKDNRIEELREAQRGQVALMRALDSKEATQ